MQILARQQAGIALVMALMLTALATALAVSVSARQFYEIRRTQNLVSAQGIKTILGELEARSHAVLKTDRELSMHDDLSETWNTEPLLVSSELGHGEGRLIDMQSLFNINDLVTGTGRVSGQPRGQGAPAPVPAAQAPTDNPPRARRASSTPTDAAPAPLNRALPVPDVPGLIPQAPAPVAAVPEAAVGIERGNTTYQPQFGGGYALASPAPPPAPQASDSAPPPAGPDIAAASVKPDAGPATSPVAPGIRAVLERHAIESGVADDQPGSAVTSGSGTQAVPPAGSTAISENQLAEARFRLLLQALDIDPSITQAVMDWMDADSDPRFPNGAEDEYYLGLPEPYRTSNAPLGSVHELLLIKGIDRPIFNKLQAYVTASNARFPVNINTAPAQVLMTLGPGIDHSTAMALIRMRESQPFVSTAQFLSAPAVYGRLFPALKLSVSSEYFLMQANASSKRLQVERTSLLSRSRPLAQAVIARYPGGIPDD